ncbi:MAG: DUF2784 family protein [Elusimicrobia bacterium]|nr:MAG: DUF2784 family protein [Elusimicrobiota bacterium]
MSHKIFADAIIVVHFLYILFMLLGFLLTGYALFFREKFFDRWLFRSLHLLGIFYVASLSILGKYCPLTILENELRLRYEVSLVYSGSFIVHYLERLVYPDVNPLVIQIPTAFLAIFTIVVFIVRPPKKIKSIMARLSPGREKL